ncbi:fluoroacetate dehalogenase domain protein [Bordetella hinzii 5132]|nr:fluoroacetate dehalogenase domain protein [Bordetella hinzii 5132]
MMMSGIDGIASWNSVAGFSELHIEAGGVAFCGVTGGSGGPPVLLLHGYPQTHLAWRHVAPRLAQSFTVVAPDLPGYGSSRPDSDRPRWTKRRVASALIALMAKLGHRRFAVVGHDRGARAGYRLALDYPGQVTHFASLAVIPTLDAWDLVDERFGRANFHWFFLAQPFGLPEKLLSADPQAFIDAALARMAGGLGNCQRRLKTDPFVGARAEVNLTPWG